MKQRIETNHQLNGHEFEQAPGNGEGQGSPTVAVQGLQRARHNCATEQPQLLTLSVGLFPVMPEAAVSSEFSHLAQ